MCQSWPLLVCLSLPWPSGVSSLRDHTGRTCRIRPTYFPEGDWTRKFIWSLTTSWAYGTWQMLSLKSLIAFVLVTLWAWTSVFPFSHVQSAPRSCYSCWLTSPKSLWAQESSKYVHFDTHVSLYSPGQHSPVFSVSFILNLHLSLRNFESLTIYSAPLNSVLLPLSWLSFSIVLFSDFSALGGLMDVFSLFFNLILFVPFVYPWSNCYHGLEHLLLPLYLFMYFWTPVSDLCPPWEFINHCSSYDSCLQIYVLVFHLLLCIFRHFFIFPLSTWVMVYDSTLIKFIRAYEFDWASRYHIEIKTIN